MPENDMTAEEALKNLDAVASQYKTTRQEHQILQRSVRRLRQIIQDEKDSED